jgi:hypothetical protein
VQWPPHDGRVSQIQCDRGPVRKAGLDAWHDAQEQEVEDAAWNAARVDRIVSAIALVALCVGLVWIGVVLVKISALYVAP